MKNRSDINKSIAAISKIPQFRSVKVPSGMPPNDFSNEVSDVACTIESMPSSQSQRPLSPPSVLTGNFDSKQALSTQNNGDFNIGVSVGEPRVPVATMPLNDSQLSVVSNSDESEGNKTSSKFEGDANTLHFKEDNTSIEKVSMEINDAYIALEQMRAANLEVEFGHKIDARRCVQCQRGKPFLSKRKHKISLRRHNHNKPCLLCGSPTCSSHGDPIFKRKNKIMICGECAPLFQLDFIMDCVALKEGSPEARERLQRKNIKHMVDVYDRVLLLLRFSGQYIDDIATKLESRSRKEDKIGIGSNTTGILSGIAGVAAAVTIVTPAGPPLLIASLLFGASAQASVSGAKAVNYYSSPSKLAIKIISYYNLLKSVLMVTKVLKEALLKGAIDLEDYVENMVKGVEDWILKQPQRSPCFDCDSDGDLTADPTEDISLDDDMTTSSELTDLTDAVSPRNSKDLSIQLSESEESMENENNWSASSPSAIPLNRESGLIDEGIITPSNRNLPNGSTKLSSATELSKNSTPINPFVAMGNVIASVTRKRSTVSQDQRKSGSPQNLSNTTVSPDKSEKSTESKSLSQSSADTNIDGETAIEKKTNAGKLARFYSRTSLASSSLAAGASVTVMAAAALSVAHIAFEVSNITKTIRRMQAGSPCKRAAILRIIKEDMDALPETDFVVKEWDQYLVFLANRQSQMAVAMFEEDVEDEVEDLMAEIAMIEGPKAEDLFDIDDDIEETRKELALLEARSAEDILDVEDEVEETRAELRMISGTRSGYIFDVESEVEAVNAELVRYKQM